jgi:hypothetical protein
LHLSWGVEDGDVVVGIVSYLRGLRAQRLREIPRRGDRMREPGWEVDDVATIATVDDQRAAEAAEAHVAAIPGLG